MFLEKELKKRLNGLDIDRELKLKRETQIENIYMSLGTANCKHYDKKVYRGLDPEKLNLFLSLLKVRNSMKSLITIKLLQPAFL